MSERGWREFERRHPTACGLIPTGISLYAPDPRRIGFWEFMSPDELTGYMAHQMQAWANRSPEAGRIIEGAYKDGVLHSIIPPDYGFFEPDLTDPPDNFGEILHLRVKSVLGGPLYATMLRRQLEAGALVDATRELCVSRVVGRNESYFRAIEDDGIKALWWWGVWGAAESLAQVARSRADSHSWGQVFCAVGHDDLDGLGMDLQNVAAPAREPLQRSLRALTRVGIKPPGVID